MAREPDDNTLDNAGIAGRQAADQITTKITGAIEGMRLNGEYGPHKMKAAVARIVANNLYDYAEELD